MNPMNATALEVPGAPRTGAWVSGLVNTDPKFLEGLVGPSLADDISLYEAAAGSLTTGRANRCGNAPLIFVGAIHGAKVTLGQVMQIVVPGASGSVLQDQVRLFNAPVSTLLVPQSCVLSFQGVATRAVLPDVQAVSSTTPAGNPSAEAKFRAAFQRGREERFEDGMESGFSQELELLVRAYGPSSKELLARLLEDESVSDRVWGEAMRALGRVDDPISREARLWVLEQGLSSGSALVRDGAALGLASLDDPSAIPYLQRAIDSEMLGGLRADMKDVLLQLTRQ